MVTAILIYLLIGAIYSAHTACTNPNFFDIFTKGEAVAVAAIVAVSWPIVWGSDLYFNRHSS